MLLKNKTDSGATKLTSSRELARTFRLLGLQRVVEEEKRRREEMHRWRNGKRERERVKVDTKVDTMVDTFAGRRLLAASQSVTHDPVWNNCCASLLVSETHFSSFSSPLNSELRMITPKEEEKKVEEVEEEVETVEEEEEEKIAAAAAVVAVVVVVVDGGRTKERS